MIALSIFGHIAFRSVALVSIRTKIGALQRIEGGCCCKGNRWRGRGGDLVERSYPLVVGAMKSADTVDGSNSDDYGDDGFEYWFSPPQVKTLRKEAALRKRNKKLATIFLSQDHDENDSQGERHNSIFDDATLAGLHDALVREELVEVRAISKSNIKQVRVVADELAEELIFFSPNESEDRSGEVSSSSSSSEEEKEVPVVVVIQRKGHSAILYRPRPDSEESLQRGKERGGETCHQTIILRTSGKQIWTKRERPQRDARGRIVQEQKGKST